MLCAALQVSLVGHSAGAQLCMMALLQRAQTTHKLSQQQMQQSSISPPVMPKQFVAITGVYDIAKHYVYERERGVHELSTMKRAMGGFEHFAAMSPAVILGQALQQQRQQQEAALKQPPPNVGQQHEERQGKQQQQLQPEPPACGFYSSFQLSGEAIAHRIGRQIMLHAPAMLSSSVQMQSKLRLVPSARH